MTDENQQPNSDSRKRFEQILKEKFGSPDFANLMDSITDQMFKKVQETGIDSKAGIDPNPDKQNKKGE